MESVRYIITPRSAWLTPWQADTLSGQLLALHARLHGGDSLEATFLEPALNGTPAFVISDALPEGLLPVPALARVVGRPLEQRRVVRSARWTTPEGLEQLLRGELPSPDDLYTHSQVFHEQVRVRNMLDRTTQGTPDQAGLWNAQETWLGKGFSTLVVHALVQQEVRGLLDELFMELADTGYGADASAGYGQFDLSITSGMPPAFTEGNGTMSLGTFQPGPSDPTEGYWEGFVKFGKLGVDVGHGHVFKRPQWMLRPGASFKDSTNNNTVGRAIPTGDLLPVRAVEALAQHGIRPIQSAYTLTISIPWNRAY